MNRGVAGALIALGVALATPGLAAAAPQSAAAFAQAAAQTAERAAEQTAFDTLVTPEALRALRRLTDSTKAALQAKESRKQAPTRTQPSQSAVRAQRTPPAAAQDPKPSAPEANVIANIGIARDDARSEVRVVAAGAATPKLSEPFRTADGTRLFLTFAGASLDAEAPAIDSLETILAGIEAAQRDDDVRIAIDAASLDRYGLETAGDTTILWLTAAAAAAAPADAPATVTARPDDLRLAGESARAGWKAFRADVARASSAVVEFLVGAGMGLGMLATSAGSGVAHGVSATVAWLGATIPVGGIARTVTFIALLLAPTAGVLLLMRRRPAAKAAAAPTPSAHARPNAAPVNASPAPAPALEVTPIARRTLRTAAPSAAANAAPALTYGPPRPRPMASQPNERTVDPRSTMAQQTTTSPVVTRAQQKAAKAIAKAEAKAARVAARVAAKAEREAAKAAARAERASAKSAPTANPKPHVTRTTADARLWAAKTLAASGADAADIARQTGLSREAAGLLVRNARTTQTV